MQKPAMFSVAKFFKKSNNLISCCLPINIWFLYLFCILWSLSFASKLRWTHMNSSTHLIIIKDIYPEGKNGADWLLFFPAALFHYLTLPLVLLISWKKQMLWMFLSSWKSFFNFLFVFAIGFNAKSEFWNQTKCIWHFILKLNSHSKDKDIWNTGG